MRLIRRRWWLLLILPALALGWWFYTRRDRPGDIIFVSNRIGHKAIYRMNANGGGVRRLLGSRVQCSDPAISPDGKLIAYPEMGVACIADINGANARPVSRDSDLWNDPAFFPDGRSLVYFATTKVFFNLYRINLDGTGKRQLTFEQSGQYGDFAPAVSPDGRFILFHSYRRGNPDIYRINADGSGLRRLTTHSAYDADPAISPDGQWIAFASGRNGTNWQIYLMDIHGRHVRRLTNEAVIVYANQPAFSPDGKRIAYTVTGGGYSDICVINIDGTGRKMLTNNWQRAALLKLPGVGKVSQLLRLPDRFTDEDPVWVPTPK